MQTQKRAILLLRSVMGKNKDFTQQREFFSSIITQLDLEIYREIEATCRNYSDSEGIIVLGTIRRHAIWRDYEYLLIPTINIFGRTPIEITEEIKFLENNGVKVISLSEGEISVENLPLVFRRQFKVIK